MSDALFHVAYKTAVDAAASVLDACRAFADVAIARECVARGVKVDRVKEFVEPDDYAVDTTHVIEVYAS